MSWKTLSRILIGLAIPCVGVEGHPNDSGHKSREIVFPDIDGYHTMSTDLHIHTAFSDGSVWPDIRVKEGLRDQLDAIAITDHLEYQPHQDDIPHPDRNRAYEVAAAEVEEEELIVINGSEITRSMPPGHANAVFLDDANPLLKDDVREVFQEAESQGAFIFWNHPSWLNQADDGIPPFSDMHRDLIEDGLLHGIEVVNSKRYSKKALRIALDHDLTIMGTSDVHGLIDWDYDVHEGGHRPVTLVFAKDHSKEALKKALFDGRTVVWKDDLLVGRKEYLVPLIEESLQVTGASYIEDSSVLEFEIQNTTGHRFILQNASEYSLHHHAAVLTLEPYSKITLSLKTLDRLDRVQMPFTVANAVIAPETHARITLESSID